MSPKLKNDESRSLSSPEGTVSGYLALPKKGSGPGVLVLHAWWGLNDVIRGVCDRLAASGFVAFAPDLYHGAVASTIDGAKNLMSRLSEETARADLAKAIAGLKAHPALRGTRRGVVGFSMGASWALELAKERPGEFAAIVLFYGTGETDLAKADTALLGHFAEKDEFEATDWVEEFEKRVRGRLKEVTLHTYPGTGHWFFEEDRTDAYNAAAAALAWKRTIQFLKGRVDGEKA